MFNLFAFFKYLKIKKKCQYYEKNLIFDMSCLDEEIANFAEQIYDKNNKKFKPFKEYSSKIGFWASTLYDTGGHTPCLVNLADSMYENEKLFLFLTKLNHTFKKAPNVMSKLEKICDVKGVNYTGLNFAQALIDGYNQIVSNAPKVIILYIAQLDIYSTALIHLLKKNTDIKFVFFDHASHFPNLAMTMADIIIEELTTTAKILTERRHITIPHRKCGLQSKKAQDVVYYSKEVLDKKREEFGISQDELLTVSGGSSYKYFDGENSSHYEMIKRLLIKMPNLKHLAITNLSKEQNDIIDKIFADNPKEKKRLIFHPLIPNYDVLFQSADLFVDSFPISSAMTQIDLMSMKVPTVVKINTEKSEWTFHEYMLKDYPYMYEKVEDMEKGIIFLLDNKEERKRIAELNYAHWANNFESSCVKKKYEAIINELSDKN